ncbi:hypothetical protein I553_0648 [Mycobacterium xenopi 4042]|uniref:Uncharacterized protein n=1 Tax=Mycobacterium xenopi 4042 TaxID=1299334 RepID=X7YLP7_MYCXE|nr:hypothetical protein I553_0648 [Mycobacterium xenopi 4042]
MARRCCGSWVSTWRGRPADFHRAGPHIPGHPITRLDVTAIADRLGEPVRMVPGESCWNG